MLRCSAGNSWSSAAATSTGNVRSANEDTYLIDASNGIWVVADGMGGASVWQCRQSDGC